eukprot:gene6343-14_t
MPDRTWGAVTSAGWCSRAATYWQQQRAGGDDPPQSSPSAPPMPYPPSSPVILPRPPAPPTPPTSPPPISVPPTALPPVDEGVPRSDTESVPAVATNPSFVPTVSPHIAWDIVAVPVIVPVAAVLQPFLAPELVPSTVATSGTHRLHVLPAVHCNPHSTSPHRWSPAAPVTLAPRLVPGVSAPAVEPQASPGSSPLVAPEAAAVLRASPSGGVPALLPRSAPVFYETSAFFPATLSLSPFKSAVPGFAPAKEPDVIFEQGTISHLSPTVLHVPSVSVYPPALLDVRLFPTADPAGTVPAAESGDSDHAVPVALPKTPGPGSSMPRPPPSDPSSPPPGPAPSPPRGAWAESVALPGQPSLGQRSCSESTLLLQHADLATPFGPLVGRVFAWWSLGCGAQTNADAPASVALSFEFNIPPLSGITVWVSPSFSADADELVRVDTAADSCCGGSGGYACKLVPDAVDLSSYPVVVVQDNGQNLQWIAELPGILTSTVSQLDMVYFTTMAQFSQSQQQDLAAYLQVLATAVLPAARSVPPQSSPLPTRAKSASLQNQSSTGPLLGFVLNLGATPPRGEPLYPETLMQPFSSHPKLGLVLSGAVVAFSKSHLRIRLTFDGRLSTVFLVGAPNNTREAFAQGLRLANFSLGRPMASEIIDFNLEALGTFVGSNGINAVSMFDVAGGYNLASAEGPGLIIVSALFSSQPVYQDIQYGTTSLSLAVAQLLQSQQTIPPEIGPMGMVFPTPFTGLVTPATKSDATNPYIISCKEPHDLYINDPPAHLLDVHVGLSQADNSTGLYWPDGGVLGAQGCDPARDDCSPLRQSPYVEFFPFGNGMLVFEWRSDEFPILVLLLLWTFFVPPLLALTGFVAWRFPRAFFWIYHRPLQCCCGWVPTGVSRRWTQLFRMTLAGWAWWFWITGMAFLVSFYVWEHAVLNNSVGRFGRWWGGFSAAFLMLLLYPVSRKSVVLYALGIPYERAVLFHQAMGAILYMASTIHGISMFIHHWHYFDCNRLEAVLYMFRWYVPAPHGPPVAGLIAWLALSAMFAFYLARAAHYVLFKWSHLLFIVVLVFAVIHYQTLFIYILLPATLYILDLAWMLASRWLWPATVVDANVYEGAGVTTLVIHKPGFSFKPGQWVNLGRPLTRFPVLFSGGSSHPFSICSWQGHHGSDCFSLHCKDKGQVDGPYGGPSFEIGTMDAIFLVAGGIGYVPVLSMLGHLQNAAEGSYPNLHTVIFSLTLRTHKDLVPIENMLQQIMEKESSFLFVQLVNITQPSTEHEDVESSIPVLPQRPNFEQILGNPFANLEMGEFGDDLESSPAALGRKLHGGKTAVYCSGPSSMAKTVCVAAANNDYFFHEEIFEL